MVDFNAVNWTGPQGLRERLQQVSDPHHRRGIRHAQDLVLLLACAAVLAGQRSFTAMSDWIHDLAAPRSDLPSAAKIMGSYHLASKAYQTYAWSGGQVYDSGSYW